jgi:hypothetical protein
MSEVADLALIAAVFGVCLIVAWLADRYEVHVRAIRKEEYRRGFYDGRFTKKSPPSEDAW